MIFVLINVSFNQLDHYSEGRGTGLLDKVQLLHEYYVHVFLDTASNERK